MKFKDTYRSLMYFSPTSGSLINKFVYHKQNTAEHEITKFFLFKKLVDDSHEVLCESKLKSGLGRVDLVDLTTKTIYEITHTEKEKSMELKKKKYPAGFEIQFIQTNGDLLQDQMSKLSRKK